jgi:dTDP-4-dehydrorhamnose reductase
MRVYVTGGTGFVGSNIAKLFAEWHGLDVTVASRRPSPKVMNVRYTALDLEDPESIRTSIRTERPDLIIHAAILNDFPTMYADRQLAWDIYVTATRELVDVANEVGATFVFVSTDWVFDGTQSSATEQTPPNPINYYGVLKLMGETLTLERARQPIVARIAGVSGVHWARTTGTRTQDAGFGHFVNALVDALSAGESFSVWEDARINQIATPSLASESGEMMWQLAQRGNSGIFHCCGGESITRLELARLAVEVFELDPSLLHSGPPDPDVVSNVPIPRDTSLDARHTAASINYSLPSVRTLLETLREQRLTGIVRPIRTAPTPH